VRELGKLLAWVLRHEPHAVGLELDDAGWAEIDALLECLRAYGRACSRAELERCVATDSKGRFSISPDGRRIRAAQGHSIPIELGLPPMQPPAVLYHGTPTRFVASILERGLERRKRHDVHLSNDPRTAVEVGRRRGEAVVLRVDAARMHRDGFEFRRSDNGVWLTQRVPPEYLARDTDSRHESPVPEALSFDLEDGRIAALAFGPTDGRPVLAMHGWLDNAATFAELAPRLCSALGLRIVSLDLPGHGLSEHKRGHYHFIDWVADAIHAADALGWARFSLLGHSMGAGIATLVAGTIPERLDRCVLIEGIGPLSDDPNEAARRLARSLRVEARKQDPRKRLFADRESAAERLREAAKMKVESARILVERGLEPKDEGFMWRADPRLRVDSRMRMSEEQVLSFLRAIACPVLLVSASQGWPYDVAMMRRRTEAIASLTRVDLPGNHHLHLDDPEAVAAAIIPFLSATMEEP
jgi:RNA:NAD 2'-phosphotransferase (TPT1/KptA family)/pimeloyl-ACP methyl ester carboxylesterase